CTSRPGTRGSEGRAQIAILEGELNRMARLAACVPPGLASPDLAMCERTAPSGFGPLAPSNGPRRRGCTPLWRCRPRAPRRPQRVWPGAYPGPGKVSCAVSDRGAPRHHLRRRAASPVACDTIRLDMSSPVVLLAGGVGGAKLAHGLQEHLGSRLVVIVNTADDVERHGLLVSPDHDTVMYTLAGVDNREWGWGVAGETFATSEMLERYGEETW